jgi:hypothetical protein
MSSPLWPTTPSGSAEGIKDPFGNIWWVISRIEDVPEGEMWKRLQEPVYAEAMRVAQETLDSELSGGRGGFSSAPVRVVD